MNIFSSSLETLQRVLNSACTSLKQLPAYLSSIGLHPSITDGYTEHLAYGVVVSLALMAVTYLMLHQKDTGAAHARKQLPKSSLPFILYVVVWSFLFGAAFFYMQEEVLKLFTLKNLYYAVANIGIVSALVVLLWKLGSSALHLTGIFMASMIAIPSSLLFLLPAPLWHTSVGYSTVVMIAVALLLYILLPFLMAYWSSLYSRYSPSLSRAFGILAKGSPEILPTIIALSALGAVQCLAINALIDNLGTDTIRITYNSTEIPLELPLKFGLGIFSFEFIRLFISVFISSKVYMDLSKEKNSFYSSLIRAISSMKAIAKASFIPSILGFLSQLCHELQESEIKKPQKNRSSINMVIAAIAHSILSFISATFEKINSLVMNYIGIYGGSYDPKTSRKAVARVSRHFGYYFYTISGIRHCMAPLLLIFWCGILFLFGDFLLPTEYINVFVLTGILTILYAVDCVHSAIISVFYYEVDTASKLQENKA